MKKINPTQTFAWNALEQHKADNLTIPQLLLTIHSDSPTILLILTIKF